MPEECLKQSGFAAVIGELISGNIKRREEGGGETLLQFDNIFKLLFLYNNYNWKKVFLYQNQLSSIFLLKS